MTCPDDFALLEFIRNKCSRESRFEIEQHLDTCDECRELVVDLLRQSSAEPVDSIGLLPRRPGPIAGRYVIEEVLGAGAMGVVVSARDLSLDRRVAVKLLSPSQSLSERQLSERLSSEGKALARLTHPNVVAVYDLAHDEVDTYLVMELVEGVTLTRWNVSAPRTTDERLAVLIDAGRGIAAAHAANFVHRDIKPDNVFISSKGRVCVGDFGLVRILEDASLSASSDFESEQLVTRTQALLGTPAYMAPEQFEGETSFYSDQFSYCVMCWELLYGERPFSTHHYTPTTRPLSPPRIDVSLRVRRALERGLSFSSTDRHPSMAALLARLERALPAQRKARRARRAVALVACMLLASLGFVSLRQRRSHPLLTCGEPPDLAAVWDDARRVRLRHLLAQSRPRTAEADWARLETTIDLFFDQWSTLFKETCVDNENNNRLSADGGRLKLQCLGNRLSEVNRLLELSDSADSSGLDRLLAIADTTTGLHDCETLGSLVISDPPARGSKDCPRRGPTLVLDQYVGSGGSVLFEGWFCSRRFPDLRSALGDDVLLYAKLESQSLPPKRFAVSPCTKGCIDASQNGPAHCEAPKGEGCQKPGWYCGSVIGLDPSNLYTCYPNGGVHLVQRCTKECRVTPPGCADECN